MLKIKYTMVVNKYNNSIIETSPFFLFLIFILFIKNTNTLWFIKKFKTPIKTLMTSPFHYKVAKKNIYMGLKMITFVYQIKQIDVYSNLLLFKYYSDVFIPIETLWWIKKINLIFIKKC